LLTM